MKRLSLVFLLSALAGAADITVWNALFSKPAGVVLPESELALPATPYRAHFSQGGGYVLARNEKDDGAYDVMDGTTGKLLYSANPKGQDLKTASYSVAYTSRNDRFLVLVRGSDLALYDLPTGKLVRKLDGGKTKVEKFKELSVEGDGVIAYTGEEGEVYVLKANGSLIVMKNVPRGRFLSSLALNPAGTRLAIAGSQESDLIGVYSTQDGSLLFSVSAPGNIVGSLEMTGDGENGRLVAKLGGTGAAWNTKGEKLTSFFYESLKKQDISLGEHSLDISADGKRALQMINVGLRKNAAGKRENVYRLEAWDLITGKHLGTGPEFGVTDQDGILADINGVSPEGKYLVVVMASNKVGSLQTWKFDEKAKTFVAVTDRLKNKIVQQPIPGVPRKDDGTIQSGIDFAQWSARGQKLMISDLQAGEASTVIVDRSLLGAGK